MTPSSPPAYETPEMPRWLTRYMRGVPNSPALAAWTKENCVEWRDNNNELKWRSNPGPQTWTQWCNFDEVLIGGRRGGSKSQALIARMVMGDPYLHELDPARTSFLNDPSFRGLFVRKEYQAMAEFVDEAMEFFRPFNCRLVDDPAVFVFNTDKTGRAGAKIYTAHLGDKEAFEKFRGWGLVRIGVEELTQIPEERWYLKLLGSLRGKKQARTWGAGQLSAFWKGQPEMLAKIPKGGLTFPALKCQIMATANPDGVGKSWTKARFVKMPVNHPSCPDGYAPWNTPVRDPISGLWRIFIPMRLEDNPYLRDNKQYKGMLASQDEVTRRQWVEGDWDAGGGLFFDSFRPNGPRSGEAEQFPWANHCVKDAILQPWWFRWASLDIGYEHLAVAHKYVRNAADQRIHVYDEMARRHMDPYELGIKLATWWLPELEELPDHQIVLYLSPDAFSKRTTEKTQAEQLEMGIKTILGPYGALLMRFNSAEKEIMERDPARAKAMFDARRNEFGGKMGIAIKAADDNRKAGCSYMLGLLRFRPSVTESEDEIRERLQKKFSDSGVEAYERERARAMKDRIAEVLPKVIFWRRCTELIRGLSEAVRGEDDKAEEYVKWHAVEGVGGDDGLESGRYGLHAFKEIQSVIPKDYYIGERMEAFQKEAIEATGEGVTDPTRLAMVAATQASRYAKATGAGPKTFSLPRASSSRHRMVQ